MTEKVENMELTDLETWELLRIAYNKSTDVKDILQNVINHCSESFYYEQNNNAVLDGAYTVVNKLIAMLADVVDAAYDEIE